MASHDDSPPDGDYAAYIEKLTRQNQAANTNQAAFGSDIGKTAGTAAPASVSPAAPATHARKNSKAGRQGNLDQVSSNTSAPTTSKPAARKRSLLPLIIVVLFMSVPTIHIARDMLQNPRPEGFFFLAVLVFMVFAIGRTIRSGKKQSNDRNGQRKTAIPAKDDYPNTGN